MHTRLPRRLQNIIDHGRQIVGANLMPTEGPEIWMLDINAGIVARIDIATGIAQPDIIACIRIVVGQRIVRPIEQETIGAAEQTVLDEHSRTRCVGGGGGGIIVQFG